METQEITAAEAPAHPRLRENIWHIRASSDTALLITSDSRFEVGTEDALRFLKMRSHCTGFHSVEEIAQRSGIALDDVRSILASLEEAGVVFSSPAERAELDRVRAALLSVCKIWSDELRLAYIGNEFRHGSLPKTALTGWLCEMYHYISDFPLAIEHGARRAEGRLKDVLVRYAQQEKHHDEFVVRTLENLGLKRDEVKGSAPLVSTRAIGLLMREMFEHEPCSVLLMAALVEAQEFQEEHIAGFKQCMHETYGVPLDAFDPFFEHQQIDVGMGHAELLADNIDLIDVTDMERLDGMVNRLHDLKHAFELQSLEIRDYYTNLNGKYFPRQRMRFSSL
ncbi:iron-containing redox enzyme family protein [Sorangium sp. So ce388]|uniref:iron-containing redox enzyme family protein n=1 Tax=Sorangium sp. So ce388 TaxID=3133309 RepID=UPI003F5C8C55